MTAWWWTVVAVAVVWIAMVGRALRLRRRDAFDSRMTLARGFDHVLASLHLIEGVAIDLRAHANNFSKAREEKPKRVQWVCPCCTYQFSVPEHTGAELVVFEWSVGKDSQWAVFIVSGGVKEEIHRIGEGGCSRRTWDGYLVPVGAPDDRALEVLTALGFGPFNATWDRAMDAVRNAAKWMKDKEHGT